MKTLVTYLLEVLACSGILLAAYTILLERRVAFRWCRAYLLCAMPLAGIIPLMRIPVWPGGVVAAAPAVVVPEPAGWGAEIVSDTASVAPETICALIWLLGTVLIAAQMCRQVVRIRRLRRGAEITRTERFTLVRTRTKIASFSFFRSVYVWAQTPAGEMRAILLHEASHIAHRHSWERIAMESTKALMWWNPFVWIAARRLTEVEEFEADRDVLTGGFDVAEYMHTIFRQLFGYSPDIANGLRDSLTKKRFKMMTTQTPGRYALLRLTGILPVVAGLLCAFSFTTRAAVLTAPEPAPADLTAAADSKQTQVNVLVMKNQQPLPGATVVIGGTDLGTVTDKEGRAELKAPAGSVLEISYIGCETHRFEVGKKKEQAIVVIMGSDDSAESETGGAAQAAPRKRAEAQGDGSPLYVMDGVVYQSLPDFDANSIKSITIFKNEQAVAMYGERGRNGVIVIATKERVEPHTDTAEVYEHTRTGAADEDQPFLIAETMPSFQGGDLNAFRMWVQKRVKYPEKALDRNITGRVVLSFVIERDGSLSGIRVLQSPDELLSDEARRVIASAPAWTPGRQRGEIVRVKYTVPVDFRIKSDLSDKEVEKVAADGPFLVAETMPQFRGGGIDIFRMWVQQNLRYPAEAMQQKIQGRVVATFIVEKDGSVGSIEVIQSPDPTLSDEARRVISSSPAWTPGKQHGELVRVKYTLPVDFRIFEAEAPANQSTAPKKSADTADEIVVVGFGAEKE